MRVLKVGSIGLAVILLAGCATVDSHPPQPTSGSQYISNVMAEDVTQAVRAQQAFEEVLAENARTLSLKQKAVDTDQVDIDYIGAPQEILQTMAYRYGYRYVETGKREDLRVVNVRVEKTSPVNVLRSISYQIAYGAKVVLDKKTKELRLVYLNVTPPPVTVKHSELPTIVVKAPASYYNRSRSYNHGG